MKRIAIILILCVFAAGCDSGTEIDFGDNFSFGYIHTRNNNNIYYNELGLIDDETIINIKWNKSYILAETIDHKYILIDKKEVIQDQGYSGKGVSYIAYEKTNVLSFQDSCSVQLD